MTCGLQMANFEVGSVHLSAQLFVVLEVLQSNLVHIIDLKAVSALPASVLRWIVLNSCAVHVPAHAIELSPGAALRATAPVAVGA